MFNGHIENCWFCGGAWGKCECDFPMCCDDPNAPGFNFEEFFITQPNVSVCGRFFVDPIVYYGEAFVTSDLARVPRRMPVQVIVDLR